MITLFRSQRFIDVFGQVYELQSVYPASVLIERIGDLPEHIERSFKTTPEHVHRMISYRRWKAI